MAMTAAEKAERKQARLEARGPVIAQIASAKERDRFFDVRYGDGGYWCPCIGFAIRKHCRHVDYCREHGITTADPYLNGGAAIMNATVKPARAEAQHYTADSIVVGLLHAADSIYVTSSQRARMVTYLAGVLATMNAPIQAAPVAAARTAPVFAMRRIVLED